MKQFYAKKALAMIAFMLLGGASSAWAVEKTYDFKTKASALGAGKSSNLTLTTSSGVSVTQKTAHTLYYAEDVADFSFDHKFAFSTANNTWYFRYRTSGNANDVGLFCQTANRPFSILNLSVGDKVTITYSGSGLTFISANAGVDAGTAVTSATEYTMTAAGHLDLYTNASAVYIHTIKIESADKTTVGDANNTDAFFTQYSPYYFLADNQSLTLEFTNHSSKEAVYCNWLIAVTNDVDRNGSGYKEYLVMRPDRRDNAIWETGSGIPIDKGNMREEAYPDADDATFMNYMNGAKVKLTVRRENGRVSVLALMNNTVNEVEKTWAKSYFFELPADMASNNIRTFLSLEKAHLVIDNTKTKIESTTKGYYTVGAKDKSSIYRSAMSDYYSVPANSSCTVHFKSHGTTTSVWNHWVGFITNNKKKNEDGYTEYLGLRSDKWGFESKWNIDNAADVYVNDGNKAFMDGADVYYTIKNVGGWVNIEVSYTGTNKENYKSTYYFQLANDNETINFYLACDLSYLEIEDVRYVNLDQTVGYTGAWDDEEVNVWLTRGITANQWSTICLPFTMTNAQQKSAFGENVKVAEITGGDAAKISFTSADAIEANKPYAIKVDANVTRATINGVTLDYNASPSATAGTWEFQGVYTPGNIPAGAYFFSDNKLWNATDNTNTIKAFRGYFTGVATARSIDFDIDDELTGIKTVESVKQNAEGEYFDLQGRKVAQPTKGLYIVNGKKVIIK